MFKKGEDKFLAILIIIAVVISVTGTFFSLHSLNDLQRYRQYFSGYGMSAQVNLTIGQNLTINVIQTVINFSSGFVNSGADYAILNTTVENIKAAPVNWTNTSLYNPKPLEIRNDGNINASINLTSLKTAETFLGGTSPLYQFNVTNKEAYSCVGTATDWTSLTAASQVACTNLGTTDTKDEIYIHCLVKVPYDTVGAKEDQWTFTATSVS